MTAATWPRGGSAGRDPFAVDEDSALEALRLRWNDAYQLSYRGRCWNAVSRDAERRHLSGSTPDELVAAMTADQAGRT